MILICILGVALFYSLFFYTVIKFQTIESQGVSEKSEPAFNL